MLIFFRLDGVLLTYCLVIVVERHMHRTEMTGKILLFMRHLCFDLRSFIKSFCIEAKFFVVTASFWQRTPDHCLLLVELADHSFK